MKSNYLLLTLLLAVCSYGTISCKKVKGSGPIVKEERVVSAFYGISSGIDGTVYVTQEGPHRLTIEAQQNILDILDSPVEGGRLNLRFQKGKSVGHHDPIIIRVSAPTIGELLLDGSGDMHMSSNLNGDNIKLAVSGSGNLHVKSVSATGQLFAEVSGSGDIRCLGGSAPEGFYSINGSGDLDMFPVNVNKLKANVSGSGDIKSKALESLDASISGSGDIEYDGNPSSVKTHVTGSGRVRKI
ncbi:DUF2807 domain-containing protein [Pseudoflavitalea sp. G-6-1-2]|uniref:head GIN domain-containing protein n=1 Tax=Pseudoflavitalea sp. G-6-1-2 TaxID=2728841 RepID=UPI00146C298A|nr:head GIN domain-containing protein [Pseudoflavitalea sp. G-6-1-2]NML19890.1 DUF2807 domain-containing protein [Pseudoflavitalea sp. G-6-1-2]